MIVVTDTSVVLNLCLLELEEVLSALFSVVQAPLAVKDEFVHLVNADPRFAGLTFPSFIILRSFSVIHPLLSTPRLHRGECEVLSLAAEIQASRVLMDERAGRAAASKLGLQCIGLLGILIEARRRNLIPAIAPQLDRLQNEARFWFSPTLRLQVLQLAGELK